MRRELTRGTGIALLLVALVMAGGLSFLASGPQPVSETASISAAPAASPTLVSELGPAVVLPPSQPVAPPRAGGAVDQRGGISWSWAAGAGLALAGLGLVHRSLTLRAGRAG